MKTIATFVILLVSCCIFGSEVICAGLTADNVEDEFYASKALYDSGDYDKAISGNEDIAGAGFESGSLYYNLGNCHMKKDEIGKAILYYEAAKRFIPRDSALMANEKYARSEMKQQDPASRKAALLRLPEEAFEYLTLGELFFLFDIIYYLAAACVILLLFVHRFRPWFVAGAVLLSCGMLLLTIPINGKTRDMESLAVVTAPVTDARLEPAEEGAIVFPLYGGMKVYILKTTRQWLKIKRVDDKVAWVKRGGVELIDCPGQHRVVY